MLKPETVSKVIANGEACSTAQEEPSVFLVLAVASVLLSGSFLLSGFLGIVGGITLGAIVLLLPGSKGHKSARQGAVTGILIGSIGILLYLVMLLFSHWWITDIG